jgi:shikimate kinase
MLATPTLILLTGPVGGGKTTTSLALGEQLRANGRKTAVIDLDVLYPMAQQTEPRYADIGTWKTVRRAAAALAESFFASGMDVVIVEGGFFDEDECMWLREHLTTEATVTLVTLNVSWEETLRRVEADTSADRVATRNPDVLRWHHDRFVEALPFLRGRGTVLDGEHDTAQGVANSIVAALGG